MARASFAVLVVLLGVGLASAVVHARRVPLTAEEVSLSRREDIEGALLGAPALELGVAERGLGFWGLGALHISNVNSEKAEDLRLYDAWGKVDEAAARELDLLLGDVRDRANVHTTELDRRMLQLLYRAAYHFHAPRVQVISAYRQPGLRSEGRHAQGKAVDFKLSNTPAPTLAAYLRTFSRVGVGIYTHPSTQFVHLDVRERSFYWLDASPPGRTWRERAIGAPRPSRDAAYSDRDDWPEGTVPPHETAMLADSTATP